MTFEDLYRYTTAEEWAEVRKAAELIKRIGEPGVGPTEVRQAAEHLLRLSLVAGFKLLEPEMKTMPQWRKFNRDLEKVKL